MMLDYCATDIEDCKNKYKEGRAKAFFDWIDLARNLVNIRTDVTNIESAIETKEAYQFIKDHWPTIQKEVIALLPQKSKRPYGFCDKLEKLIILANRLDNGIPPNELTFLSKSPASLRDIIAAAWIYKMDKVAENENWGNRKQFDFLFRLVLKACESSYVHSTWGTRLREGRR